MNQFDIIKRAFNMTRRYRVLWIFGILLALTGGGGNNANGNLSWLWNRPERDRGQFPFAPPSPNIDPGTMIGLIALCCILILLLAIVFVILQYVARSALYRIANQIEETGTAPTWREGFRLGWTNRSFRLFLLDLIVGIPFFILSLLVLAVAASPLLLLLARNEALNVVAIILTVFLALLAILLIIVAGVIVSVLGEFWSREIVLGDRSIGNALSSGYELVRRRVKDVGVMWLLVAAIGLGFGIVIIPLVVIVLALAALVGGGLGYALYAATQSVALGVALGLPLFLIILVVPLALVQGLYMAWKSSTWTLTYRELAGGTTDLEPPVVRVPVV